jgi:SAM-dependent methyltransferase
MPPPYHPRLTPTVVKSRFDGFSAADDDAWHSHTAAVIRREITLWRRDLFGDSSARVLNAGSGGDDLNVCPPSTVNLDISHLRLKGASMAVAGSIEQLPLASGTVDVTLCVGSVINYCDPVAAIHEFRRVSRAGACLVLEFESSRSAEFLLRKGFGSAAMIAETFYGSQHEIVWAYQPEYIEGLLRAVGFAVRRRAPIHLVSPWVLLVSRSVRFAAAFAALDARAGQITPFRHWASNHLWLCGLDGADDRQH